MNGKGEDAACCWVYYGCFCAYGWKGMKFEVVGTVVNGEEKIYYGIWVNWWPLWNEKEEC